MQSINLKSSNIKISITLITHQIFFRRYLFKIFTLENLKNLNKFPREYLILMPQWREKVLDVTSSPLWINNSEKQLWLGVAFLINIGKIINAENLFACKRWKNLCVKLLRKSKKVFCNNLNVTTIANNKKFWQTIKSNFTDKTLKDESIILVDGDKVITEEKDVVKKFKDHFEKIIGTLEIDLPILSD